MQSETRCLYSGMLVVQQRDSANNPVVTYTRGRDLSGTFEGAGGIGGLLARSHGYSAGTWSTHNFYHADGNGNITYLVDTNQALAATYKYDPYGNTISSSGSLAAANLFRFSSKEFLTNAVLYYYGYRFYDPLAQRWPNRDPLEEGGGINLYTFALNDPIHLVDFWGHKSACAEWRDKHPEEKDWGGVVCKDGKKHFCVWTPKGMDSGVDYCIGQHERDHADDIDCPKTCDGSVSRPVYKPGKSKDKEECSAWKLTLDCLKKQKPASCGKLSGTARQKCLQDFDTTIQQAENMIKKHCK